MILLYHKYFKMMENAVWIKDKKLKEKRNWKENMKKNI